ncbi:MAG: FAD-dependent oxidoreductase [Clostridia bacterium]
MFDAVIIGQGPAGISTALYAIRGGLSVLVIANGDGSLAKADKIENYYGFVEPISGGELLANGIAQAKRLGVEFCQAEVVDILWEGAFRVVTTEKTFETKTVTLATGSVRKAPHIANLSELEGKGVSYCAVCDGFFYRKKTVAVLGNSNYASSELNHLVNIVGKCYLLTNGLPCEFALPDGVELIDKKISSLNGANKLEGATFDDGSVTNFDGLFVAVGQAQSDSFARKLGVATSGTFVVTNAGKMTNIPGLFAVGDCSGGMLQIAKAVSDGAIAGTEIIKYIKAKK